MVKDVLKECQHQKNIIITWNDTMFKYLWHNPKQTNQANEKAYRDYDEYERAQIARVSKEVRQPETTPPNLDNSANTPEYYIQRD